MPIIILLTIAIYIVAITWTTKNLGGIQKNKKVAFILIGFIICFIATLVIFNFSKLSIQYESVEKLSAVRNVLVAIFTGLNATITLPQIGRIIDKLHENEIDKKKASKRLAIIFIIFIVCLIFECGYMKDTQEGILKVYNSVKK